MSAGRELRKRGEQVLGDVNLSEGFVREANATTVEGSLSLKTTGGNAGNSL
jgi:hypothetical protein